MRIEIFLLSLFLCVLILSCSCVHEQNDEYDREIENYEKAITKLMTKYRINIISYIIYDETNVIANKSLTFNSENERIKETGVIYKIGNLGIVYLSEILKNKVNKGVINKYKVIDRTEQLRVIDFLSSTNETNPSLRYSQDSISIILKEIIGNDLVKLDMLGSFDYLCSNLPGRGLLYDKDDIKSFPENPFDSLVTYYAGYNVQRFFDRNIFWHYSESLSSSAITFKIEPENISVLLMADNSEVFSPLKVKQDNILYSPFFVAFIKSFFYPGTTCLKEKREMDFMNSLEKEKKTIFLYELLEEMWYSQDNPVKMKSLKDLCYSYSQGGLLAETIEKKCIASLIGGNNFIGYRNFYIDSAKKVKISCVGEGFFKENFYCQAYENDCIELFFDLNNNKSSINYLQDQDMYYRFTYGLKNISGSYLSKDRINFAYNQASDTTYSFECSIPWKTLNFSPSCGAIFGFDVTLNDNDGNGMEGASSFKSFPDKAHRGTDEYADIFLNKTHFQHVNNFVSAGYVNKAPRIDGKPDSIWKEMSQMEFKYQLQRRNRVDLNAYLKMAWDYSNLYVFIDVVDDHIHSPFTVNSLRDYGWIQDSHGNEVWKVNISNIKKNKHCNINYTCRDSITLKKGRYRLYYNSDQGHYFQNSYHENIDNYYYGISVFELP